LLKPVALAAAFSAGIILRGCFGRRVEIRLLRLLVRSLFRKAV
jgi:hypothetical protein